MVIKLYEEGLDDARPNANVFHTALQAWAASRDPALADRSEALLRRMEELVESGIGNVQPTATMQAFIVNAYTKLGRNAKAARRAKRALSKLEGRFESTGNEALHLTPLL